MVLAQARGYALLGCDIDFRVGGKWRRCMSNGLNTPRGSLATTSKIEGKGRLNFCINEYDRFETVSDDGFVDEHSKTRMYFQQTPFISVEAMGMAGAGRAASCIRPLCGAVHRRRLEPQRTGHFTAYRWRHAEDIVAARRGRNRPRRRA